MLQFGNDELLAKIAILEILLNQEINDYTHNRRMAIDVWSGKKYIIPHDFIYNLKKILEESFELDFCSTRLFCVLNQSSEFLDIKYNLLYKVVKDQNIFDDIIEDLKTLKSQYLISQKTEQKKVFFNRHILDCAQIIDFIDLNIDTTTDIGSGAGMPGKIIAIIQRKNELNI